MHDWLLLPPPLFSAWFPPDLQLAQDTHYIFTRTLGLSFSVFYVFDVDAERYFDEGRYWFSRYFPILNFILFSAI